MQDDDDVTNVWRLFSVLLHPVAHDHEMTVGADGQEFSHPLHDGQNEDFRERKLHPRFYIAPRLADLLASPLRSGSDGHNRNCGSGAAD